MKHILFLAMAQIALLQAFAGFDPRYGVYGSQLTPENVDQYSSNPKVKAIYKKPLPYREGGESPITADFFRVGHIEQFGLMKDWSESEIIIRWNFLPDDLAEQILDIVIATSGGMAVLFKNFIIQTTMSGGWWCYAMGMHCILHEEIVEAVERSTLTNSEYQERQNARYNPWGPLGPVETTKQAVLNYAFTSEVQAGVFSKLDAFASAKHAQSPSRDIVIEIGNEPNVFPYMSPKLAAYWFLKWRTAILQEFQGRPWVGKLKFMNGGLWIYEGLPAGILEALQSFKTDNTSTLSYWNGFIQELENQSGQASGAVLDYANIHFYPYMSIYTTYTKPNQPGALPLTIPDFGKHVTNLSTLIDIASADVSSRKVWITEFGNINPTDEAGADELLNNTLDAFEDISRRKGTLGKWFYFQVLGEDSKWGNLPDKGNRAVGLLLWFFKSDMFGQLFTTLDEAMGTDFFGSRSISGKAEILTRYLNQLPVQGLFQEGSDGSPVALRKLGETYILRAWKPSLAPMHMLLLE